MPLLLLVAAALAVDVVTLDLDTWEVLRPDPPAPRHAPTTEVLERRVVLASEEGAWRVQADWTVAAAPGADLRLAAVDLVPEVLTVDGRPADAAATGDGLHLGMGPGVHRVRLVGTLPRQATGTPVDLLPATRGWVEVPEGFVVGADGALAWLEEGWATGAGVLTVAPAPARAPTGPVAVAEVGLGVTVGAADVDVRARVRWRVRRGRLDAVELRVPGAPPDVVVEGVGVAEVVREGDRVRVRLDGPVPRVDLTLAWSRPLPEGARLAWAWPRLEVLGASEGQRAALLARDTDAAVEPPRGELVLVEDLPAVARDLVRGEPVAALAGDVRGEITVVRGVPADQPRLWVDVASWVVGLSDEGRVLAQGTLTVRNERAAGLSLRLAPGQRLIAAAVGGRPVAVVRRGEAWELPLPRSVETVRGLVSFPVDLTVLETAGRPWSPGAVAVDLRLPELEAPVGVRRVTVNLPPGYLARPGADGVVDAFTEGEGLAYGFGVADEARAHELFADALQAWQENRFEVAQDKVDALRAMGAVHGNVDLLDDNLQVVRGGTVDADAEAVARVRAQAKARAFDAYAAQEETVRRARKAEAVGDAEGAAAAYREVSRNAAALAGLEAGGGRQAVLEDRAREALTAEAPPAPPVPTEAGLADRRRAAGLFPEAGPDWVSDDPGPPVAAAPPDPADVDESRFVRPELPDRELRYELAGMEVWDGALVGRASGWIGGGAAGHGIASRGEVLTKDFLRKVPTGRSYQEAVQFEIGSEAMVSDGRGRGRARRRGVDRTRGMPLSVLDAPPGSGPVSEDGPLLVTAAGVAAVVPVFDATVRFQHVLVEPGDAPALTVLARPTRRSR
ncbi:MAG: hypothetical protein H6732_05705 [Alphaproteobacteria bacterium]|nr:hypothetical protein [Alphaproteobacteria bacterium]